MKEVKQCGDGGSDGPDNINGYLEQLSRFMEMEGNEQRESKAAAHSPATTNTHMHNIHTSFFLTRLRIAATGNHQSP